MANPDPPSEVVPVEILVQVKQSLEHLYDLPFLQRCPLAQELESTDEGPGTSAGQRLRRTLIVAIDVLDPGPGFAFRSPQARLYHLLHLHYVEGMAIQEAARELGISRRQAYRDLKRGEESIATVIWTRRPILVRPTDIGSQDASVGTELARLVTAPFLTDLSSLLLRAQKAVEPLAHQRGVAFQIQAPAEPTLISANPTIAQQLLISALSLAVQQARTGTVHVTLDIANKRALLTLRFSPDLNAREGLAVEQAVRPLADRLGWTIQQAEEPGGTCVIMLQMESDGPRILIIDDNQGLIDLLSRYLTGQNCQVFSASTGQQGLQLALEMAPAVVILDVMMPGTDGWETLQTLRTGMQTSSIPVIICSVIDDRELALSLGASLVLPKPVRREQFLTALHQLKVL